MVNTPAFSRSDHSVSLKTLASASGDAAPGLVDCLKSATAILRGLSGRLIPIWTIACRLGRGKSGCVVWEQIKAVHNSTEIEARLWLRFKVDLHRNPAE